MSIGLSLREKSAWGGDIEWCLFHIQKMSISKTALALSPDPTQFSLFNVIYSCNVEKLLETRLRLLLVAPDNMFTYNDSIKTGKALGNLMLLLCIPHSTVS